MADGANQHGGDPDASRGGTAAELMSWPVITIGLEAEVAKAARRLPKHVIRRILVIDASGRLVGIVSHSDVLTIDLRPTARSDATSSTR